MTIDDKVLRLRRADSARIIERARRRRGVHNERRPFVVKQVVDHLREQYRRALVRAYQDDQRRLDSSELTLLDSGPDELVDLPVAAALARGQRAPEEWEAEIATRIRRVPEVRAALDRMWPVLSGAELVHDLFSFPALIRSAADGVLARRQSELLFRPRSSSVQDVEWTEADVALIDEADALLGPPEAGRLRRRRRRSSDAGLEDAARVISELGLGGYTTAREVAERYGGGNGASPDPDTEPRTFAHVLVDEAQDLTAMQWRMLGRRCPTGSMTLVGDFGQAARPGALGDWDEVVAQLPARQPPRVVQLTVNYRTPAEIMEVADRVLAAAAPGIAPARAVRSTGRAPRFVTAGDRAGLVAAAADAVRAVLGEGGTAAVIASSGLQGAVVHALADVGAAAGGPEIIDAPVAVLDGWEAKGLEFDHVVVVEPSELVTPDAAGLRLLYVILTRATRTLTVAHTAPLPEALEPLGTS